METPFLHLVARDLIAKYGNGLCEVNIIVPSQRAHKFLLFYLSQEINKTFIAPNIITIDEFMSNLSGLKTIDNIQLLLELFLLNKEVESMKDNDIVKFSGWAEQFLSDINDIDMHLVDAKSLFTTIADVKELSLFGLPVEERTVRQKTWLQFFKNLFTYYDTFNISLLQRHCGYQGMIYRYVADHIHEIVSSIKDEKFLFCGFNALTKAEKKIFGVLHHHQIAEFYWDADTYYLDNPIRDAGRFLRENFQELKIDNPSFIGNYFSKSSKEINVVSAQNNMIQVKYVGELLNKMSPEELNHTALVLADEKLLLPLLNSITLSEVNITMGLPVSLTQLYNFFVLLFEMQKNVSRASLLKTNFKDKIYIKDIISILSHVFCSSYLIKMGTNPDALIEDLQRYKRTFYTVDELLRFSANSKLEPLFKELFSVWDSSTLAVLSMQNVLESIASVFLININIEIGYNIPENRIFENSYISLIKVFERLNTVCQIYGEVINITNLFFLFESEAKKENLSFKGNAKNGLQLMGVLETRTLDFENVILLSVNETVLPSGKTNNSLIPFDVKRYFSLPSYSYKDAVFSYHFFRLIQRASKIYLIAIESINEKKSERSRFINQLIYELPKENPNVIVHQQTIHVEGEIKLKSPKIVVKDEVIIKAIMNIPHFSPSSLIKYINCPMQFFFSKVQKVSVLDELLDSADDSTLGNVVHGVMEDIYLPQIGSKIQILPSIFTNIETLIESHFMKPTNKVVLHSEDLKYGKNRLVKEIAKRYIDNILNADQNNTEPMILKFLEKELSCTIKLHSHEVMIKGTADRIDQYPNGPIRIMDYKTGTVDAKSLKVNNIDDLFYKIDMNKAFQLLMYALLFHKDISDKEPICSVIFSARNYKNPFAPLLIEDSEVISSDVLEQFESGLIKLLEDLFNPDVDFKQTEDVNRCSYCDYKIICNR